MKKVLGLFFATLTAALLCSAPAGAAQVSINIGVAPECPYGYFSYAPYGCAPYGYYGPDWFEGGVFIGAGPWFHGPAHFSGHVDNRFDPRRGYKGPMPARRDEANNNFHGNEARDGKGHVVKGEHNAGNEHTLPGRQEGGGHSEGHR